MVVLAVVAAIGVVISVIAAAIAVLPRENRYAIGAQTSHSVADRRLPALLPLRQPPASSSAVRRRRRLQQHDLPSPVLAAAAPRVVPNKTAVANKIRAIKVKGMTGSYSGSVVEVGTGKVVYAHNATRWLRSRPRP